MLRLPITPSAVEVRTVRPIHISKFMTDFLYAVALKWALLNISCANERILKRNQTVPNDLLRTFFFDVNDPTDGQTEGGDCITFLANAVRKIF